MTRFPWPAEQLPVDVEKALLSVPGAVAGPWRGQWMVNTPNGHLGMINTKKWTIIEHEDGTITVSPSISVRNADQELWHGFLEAGIWRSV